MNTEKVSYKEAFENFNPKRFCDQLGMVMSRNSDYETTYELIPKDKEKADES